MTFSPTPAFLKNLTENDQAALGRIQAELHEWVQQFNPPYWPPLATTTKLSEEVGEICKMMIAKYGPGKPQELDTQKLGVEIGDALFMLAAIANIHGINLDEAWKQTMQKNRARDVSRWK